MNEFLNNISSNQIKNSELKLWSYSPKEKSSWSWLNKARLEFGETVARGSEPDIIILTDKALFFIEAKLTAGNKTEPSDFNKSKNYELGGAQLIKQLFKDNYETIAIREKRYELMSFWLLGSWIAKQLNLVFEFHSLVFSGRDKLLETEFGNKIIQSDKRKFSRITWEQIYRLMKNTNDSIEKQIITDYFNNKTIGYNSSKKLVKVFKT